MNQSYHKHKAEDAEQPNKMADREDPNSSEDREAAEPEIHKKIKQEPPQQDSAWSENEVSSQVLRSRETNQDKKSRWKPSSAELKILRKSFEKNQYPPREEKEQLLKLLKDKFRCDVGMNQLARWFQHQRERSIKSGGTDLKKHTYKKFNNGELEYLQNCFKDNNYPSNEEMTEMAAKLSSSFSKIENWFKHNRRSLSKKGQLVLKIKKFFKKNELDYLNKCFSLFTRPTKPKYKEMAQTLGCDVFHIKNWYSNQRKKRKGLLKRDSLENNLDQTADNITQNSIGLRINDAGTSALPQNFAVPQDSSVFAANRLISSNAQGPNALGSHPPLVNGAYHISPNGNYPITTNGTAQIIAGGMIPVTSFGTGSIPTNTTIPMNTTIPIVSGGFLPTPTPMAIPIQMNGAIPTAIPQQQILVSENTPMLINGTVPFYASQSSQGVVQKPIPLQLIGQRPSSTYQQVLYPQPSSQAVYMVPSTQPFPQCGQVLQINQPEAPRNTGFYNPQSTQGPVQSSRNYNEINSVFLNNKPEPMRLIPHVGNESQKLEHPAPIQRPGQDNSPNEFSSRSSDEGNELQQSRIHFSQQSNEPFTLKPLANLQPPQGSTSEISNSNNNSSGSVSSDDSSKRRSHGHRAAISHQAHQMPQIPYYITMAPPWQNGVHSYGPTYQNNSYIYNSSTSFSNYGNGFPMQPIVANTVATDLPVYRPNAFAGKGPLIQSGFENMDRQQAMQQSASSNFNQNNKQ